MYSKKSLVKYKTFYIKCCTKFNFKYPIYIFFGILGAALATLIASSISLFFSLYYAKKFAPILYDKKKILCIFGFIFLSTVYSVLINEKLINFDLIQNLIISSMIVVSFLIYGYLSQIYNKNNIKEILKLK